MTAALIGALVAAAVGVLVVFAARAGKRRSRRVQGNRSSGAEAAMEGDASSGGANEARGQHFEAGGGSAGGGGASSGWDAGSDGGGDGGGGGD